MTEDDKIACRNIADFIIGKKATLDFLKDKIELAAMVKNAQQNDPHPSYTYAHSYDGIIRCLLHFDAKLMPQWIDPRLHPNGKMMDTSPAEKSKTISSIKGQLRIDKGGKARDERVAGFYAWLNAFHPATCEELHEAMVMGFGLERKTHFPNLLNEVLMASRETADSNTIKKSPIWNELLSKHQNSERVILIDYKSFSFNLVELARRTQNQIEKFKFGDEFIFEIDSQIDGHVIALQTYKSETYALPLSTSDGLTVIKQGQNFYPIDHDDDEVIPLSENTDLGIHTFIFIIFAGTPPHFDYLPLYGSGAPIRAEILEALANKLRTYPKRQWTLHQLQVDFQ